MTQAPRDRSQPITGEDAGPGTLDRIKQGIGLLALAALALFLLQNLQRVEVHFLWFDWQTRMLWALLASAAFGAIGTFLVSTLAGRRREPER